MLRLNDDCLSHIFDHLRLRDQLRLISVSERFRDISFAVHWCSRFRRFKSNRETAELTNKQFLSLLKLIANRIEHFTITDPPFAKYTNFSTLNSYLRPDFSVLRVLKIYTRCMDRHIKLLAANCPLIEELYVHNMIEGQPLPYIVRMSHLRVLHLSRCVLAPCEFRQILTSLPLTELSGIGLLWDDSRSLAESLIAASDLRILRIGYPWSGLTSIPCVIALLSKSERRHPLTVYLDFNEHIEIFMIS